MDFQNTKIICYFEKNYLYLHKPKYDEIWSQCN